MPRGQCATVLLLAFGMVLGAAATVDAADANAEERVLVRIHAIQAARPGWIEKHGKNAESDALMQTLREQLASKNFVEAEKTADALLTLMGVSLPEPQHARPHGPTMQHGQQGDPFSVLAPPQLLCLAEEQLQLSPQQREVIVTLLREGQSRLKELTGLVQEENAALRELLAKEELVEEAILAQLNTVLDHEREAKQINARLAVAAYNTLSVEQVAKLRALKRDPEAVGKLEKQFQARITGKVQRVMEGAQRWAQSGRDPSAIAAAMDSKVRPLMDEGRVFEADAALDQVLQLIDEPAK